MRSLDHKGHRRLQEGLIDYSIASCRRRGAVTLNGRFPPAGRMGQSLGEGQLDVL